MKTASVEPLQNMVELSQVDSCLSLNHLNTISSDTVKLVLFNTDNEPFFEMSLPNDLIKKDKVYHAIGWYEDKDYKFHVLGLSQDGQHGISISVCDFRAQEVDASSVLSCLKPSGMGIKLS